MVDLVPTQVEMVLLPAHGSGKRCEPFAAASGRAGSELMINVLADPRLTTDQLSHDFVRRAQAEIPWIVSEAWYEEGTWQELEIRFDLGHRGFRTTFTKGVHISRASELGSDLPPGVDVLIGGPTIREVRRAMRRAYLSPAAAGFCPVFADSGARRSGFRDDPGRHSEMKPVTIPG